MSARIVLNFDENPHDNAPQCLKNAEHATFSPSMRVMSVDAETGVVTFRCEECGYVEWGYPMTSPTNERFLFVSNRTPGDVAPPEDLAELLEARKLPMEYANTQTLPPDTWTWEVGNMRLKLQQYCCSTGHYYVVGVYQNTLYISRILEGYA